MASLFFPQLSSGALAQYPIRKVRLARTIKNVLADGTILALSDPDGSHLLWEMAYSNLSLADTQALQNHFGNCLGPYHAFTFIDPTDNMLSWSSDLQQAVWNRSSLIQISSGIADPNGGTGAFTLTNTGQAAQQISQTLNVPAGYQYCFSLYAMSSQASNLVLVRTGSAQNSDNTSALLGPAWTRITSSGQLTDSAANFSVGIDLAPGQQITVYGLQLEAQIAPSRYRPTGETGGVYANAHWGIDQLTVTADAPAQFSTSFTIETAT